jgi:hypothetical protein
MGALLDHSTNTIILDAVLTTKGRRALAQLGAGGFNIASFSLNDDEVQYNLVRQYGRVIGKEYIEKLTPVLEANTTIGGCNSYLVTFSNPHKTQSTQINPSAADYVATSNTLSMDTTRAGSLKQIDFEQAIAGGRSTSPDERDNIFIVRMRADQFQLQGGNSPIVDQDGIAEYRIGSSGVTTSGGGKLSLSIGLSPQLQDSNRYKGSASSGKAMNIANSENQARGILKVKGLQSGVSKTINILVTKV